MMRCDAMLLSALPALTALHLYGCRTVTDEGVCAVAQSLTRLTTLNVGDGAVVTDVAVAAVARLPRVAQLNLRAATEMTDVGARALAAASTLTCLDLSRVRCCMLCPHVCVCPVVCVLLKAARETETVVWGAQDDRPLRSAFRSRLFWSRRHWTYDCAGGGGERSARSRTRG